MARGACVEKGACVVKGGVHGKGGACMAKGACVVKGGACMAKSGGVHGMHAPLLRDTAGQCILLECILV